MLTWVAAKTGRLVIVGAALWLCTLAIALLNPLDPQALAMLAASWPLWLSIPVVVVAVAVHFGSWAAAITTPIIGYALIAHGRPWQQDSTRSRGRRVGRRATSPTNNGSGALDDTVIHHTRITARSRRIIGA